MANRQYEDPTTHEILGRYTKVQLNGEATPVMDISDASLTASTGPSAILTGNTAYGNDGELITGACDYDVNSSASISGVELISDGSKLLSGYGAYAGGNAITGTITIQDSQTVSAPDVPSTTVSIPNGYYSGKNVTITGITGQMIAEGTTLFGIPGEHGGAAPVQQKTATSSLQAQTITPDEGYVLSQVAIAALPQTTTQGTHGYTLTLG